MLIGPTIKPTDDPPSDLSSPLVVEKYPGAARSGQQLHYQAQRPNTIALSSIEAEYSCTIEHRKRSEPAIKAKPEGHHEVGAIY